MRVAPLARNSSFSSCQGSGYHTPDDLDDDDNTTTSRSVASVKSTSSSEHEQLLAQADSEICIDDFASDAQTDYADVHSLSDADESIPIGTTPSATLAPPAIAKRRLPPSPFLLSPVDANIQLVVQVSIQVFLIFVKNSFIFLSN